MRATSACNIELVEPAPKRLTWDEVTRLPVGAVYRTVTVSTRCAPPFDDADSPPIYELVSLPERDLIAEGIKAFFAAAPGSGLPDAPHWRAAFKAAVRFVKDNPEVMEAVDD